jgi:hypothetical protein
VPAFFVVLFLITVVLVPQQEQQLYQLQLYLQQEQLLNQSFALLL